MTTVEVKLTERLARDARKAGLLTTEAIEGLLREAIRKRAAQAFLAVSGRVAAAGVVPMSEAEIQAEVNAVRKERGERSPRKARARRR